MTSMSLWSAAAVTSLIVSTSGCETLKTFGEKGYTFSCVKGALVGSVFAYATKGKGTTVADKAFQKRLMVAAAGGCAVGLAVTAVGKALNARQQALHEESVQRTAKRQAKELQAYSQTKKQYSQMPTPASASEKSEREQRMARELEQIKQKYESPDTQDLGEGATSTVTPVFPATAEDASSACFEQRVLVRTPTGTATQVQTLCPDKSGTNYVRAEVKEDGA